MLRIIQGIMGVKPRQEQDGERGRILREVMEARKQLEAARGRYEGFGEYGPVWTSEAHDTRMSIAYLELKAAEDRYAVLIREAKEAGVTASWEDVVAV